MNVTQRLLPELHTVLELDERETPADSSRKKDKRQLAVSFPLNQLTWAELSRMILINSVMIELDRTPDDRQHLLRGSKQSNFRIMKNIVRNIRYRWYLRSTKRPNLSNLQPKETIQDCTSQLSIMQYALTGDENYLELERTSEKLGNKSFPNIFNSEEELMTGLINCADSDGYPEIYRRCAKVLLRLIDTKYAVNFMWEVDQELYPDYYAVMKRPFSISNIASKLLEREYPLRVVDSTIDDEMKMANEFYADVKQVFLNCITFNSELQNMMAQAHKLLLMTHRLMQCWIYSKDRPEPSNCNEKYCMLTGASISSSRIEVIRCGKCMGIFNVDALMNLLNEKAKPSGDARHQLREYCIEPIEEMYGLGNEEWHCPYCLQEDYLLCQRKLDEMGINNTDSSFFINEWGPSAIVPWLLNPRMSNVVPSFVANKPYMLSIVDAIHILSNYKLSPIDSADGNNNSAWNAAERSRVLYALIQTLQMSDKVAFFMNKLSVDCSNLLRACERANFREGDFMQSVKELCGEEGVKKCRNLLDGISSSNSDNYVESFVTEGRCVVCNGSTFDEDDNNDNNASSQAPNEVILCDACNAEAHLRCLNLNAVPSEAWYCSSCQVRLSRREIKPVIRLDKGDKEQNSKDEEALVEVRVDLKLKTKNQRGLNASSRAGSEVRRLRVITLSNRI